MGINGVFSMGIVFKAASVVWEKLSSKLHGISILISNRRSKKEELIMSKYHLSKYYCLYCKHYKPTQCGSEGTEPEGICCNPHTATDYVYGHDYCEQYDERK